MKIWNKTVQKITRFVLWTMVGLLLAFIIFMTGGAFALYQIEQECETTHIFQTQEGKTFLCNVIKMTPQRDGDLS